MKRFLIPLAGLAMAGAAGDVALAASPAYCALYAREYANQFTEAAGQASGVERRIQDEAYYRCLNLDEDPAMPESSAYFSTDTTTVGAVGGPYIPLEGTAGKTASADAAPAEETAAEPPKKAVAAKPKPKYYGSGLAAWSPEWKAWCQEHFPNSFDEKTGMILPYKGPRMFCR